ncbi:hypothetical protein [Burkholderia sp. 3C]
MPFPFLGLDAWVEKTIETYQLAVRARNYSDLDNINSPILRCRAFIFGANFFAVAGFAFLLFTLNVNAFNIERSPSRSDGLSDTAVNFVESIAPAFSLPSIHNLVFSRQFEVLAITIILSLISSMVICALPTIKVATGVDWKRRFAFASLTVSVGLINFGFTCATLAALIMLARAKGHTLPPNSIVLSAIISLSIIFVPVVTYLAHRLSHRSSMIGLGNVRSPAFYSAAAPLMVMFMLVYTAGWVNNRFHPGFTILLSGHCNAPTKKACIATIKPKDVDGKVALQSVRAQLTLGYADELNITGPRRQAVSDIEFEVVQNTDTPLPVQLTTDVTEGVIKNTVFHCPSEFVGKSRKLIILHEQASSQTIVLDGHGFGSYKFIPASFASNAELIQLLKGNPDKCSFFP